MQKYWKKAIATMLVTGGLAASGGCIYTIATNIQRNFASILNNSDTINFPVSTPIDYKAAVSRKQKLFLPLQPVQEKKNDSTFHDAVTIAMFTNTVNQDILITGEPEFIPKSKANHYGLDTLCEGACVYVEMHGGYSKYDLQEKQTTFTHKVCDVDSDNNPYCNVEEYSMDGIYLVINKKGDIRDYGKIRANEDNLPLKDYVTVFSEEEYNNQEF